jgi:hypothetical protein
MRALLAIVLVADVTVASARLTPTGGYQPPLGEARALVAAGCPLPATR